MPSDNMQLAERILAALPLDDLASAMSDRDRIAEMAAVLEPFVDPEVQIARVGPEYTGEGIVYLGLAGFVEFWTDWLEPWDSYRIETEEFLDAGDKVVQLVRQSGQTNASDVPIESRAAAVMTFKNGKLTRIEFHLDRDVAMRSAGLSE